MSDLYKPGLAPAPWVTEAESWWLATELIRRHPHSVILYSDGGPQGVDYNSLGLSLREFEYPEDLEDWEDLPNPAEVALNRNGRIHVFGTEGEPMSWWEHLEQKNPMDTVLAIERALRLESPRQTPSSNSRVLAYRVIAALIAAKQHAPQKLWAHSSIYYVDETEITRLTFEGLRRTVLANMPQASRSDEADLLTEGFWILNDDDRRTRFIFHDSGWACAIGGKPHHLMMEYDRNGRSLEKLIEIITPVIELKP